MATQKSTWAVLLCKVKSDATGQFDPSSEPPNAAGVLPFRTVCENFFTNPNAGFNAVRFFSDMSHGKLDLSGSQVLGWYTLDVNITGYTAAGDPILDKTQGEVVALARQTAINAGVSLNSFMGVVVIMNIATGWAQGAPGWMAADWRRVDGRNFDGTLGPRGGGGGNGTEIFGQEMGHGYGLGHSRRDGSLIDYQDMWDIMSTKSGTSAPDPEYCARGPGLNAWNMRGRGWLDESRVWHGSGQAFSETVQLRPLHQRELDGWLAAELPSNGGSSYLVEFRMQEGWDAGIPKSTVLVHRYLTENQDNDGWPHSYLMRGMNGQLSLSVGDTFESGTGPFSKMKVVSIDEINKIATVELCYSTNPKGRPSVMIEPREINASRCSNLLVEGAIISFRYRLTNILCASNYRVLWSVLGASTVPGEKNDGPSFSLISPDPSKSVTVSIQIVFDDGTLINDSYSFKSITQREATFREFICKVHEGPIPWWEWDPEKYKSIAKDYSREELKIIEQKTEMLLQTLRTLNDIAR